MSDDQDATQHLTEIEQKIKHSETSLRDAQAKSTAAGVVTIVCIGLLLFSGGAFFKFFMLLYLGFNIWRIYSAENEKKKIERELKEYRNKKAGLPNLSTPAE